MIKIPKDALDELIVTEPSNPTQIIADIIRDYMKIANNNLLFEPEFNKQQVWKKILLVLIGRKALKIKNLIENEEITLKELSKIVSSPKNSVTKYISRELKGVVQISVKGGSYLIPNYNLMRCKEMIENKKTKGRDEK